MLTQLSNLQNFINNHLRDVVDWRKNVLPANDPSLKDKVERSLQRETTGDQAHVVICTDYNKYYLAAVSVYVDPPMGAPLECRTLGTVMFEELTSDAPVRFIRPRQDQTFIDIARQVRKSELKSCIADVRRQLAECDNDEQRKILSGRLPALAAKAKEYGVEIVGLPIPAAETTMPQVEVGEVISQVKVARDTVQRLENDRQHFVNTPVSDDLYVGCPIIYVTNPGEAIAGQREIPGVVNKIYAGDRISGCFFPDHSEVMHKDNLVRRGGLVHFNCWDYNPGYLRMIEIVQKLKQYETLVQSISVLDEKYLKLNDLVMELATAPQKIPSDVVVEKHKSKAK